MKILLILLFCLFCQINLNGCVNNFAINFHDRFATTLGGRPANIEFYNGKPKHLYGGNPHEDYIKMVENGYELLGYSSFDSSEGPIEDALSVAQNIGAEFLIYYATYTHTVSGNIPIIVQNPNQTATSYGVGNIVGPSGSATFNSTISTTMPGGYTNYNIPYSVDNNNYVAAYWSKIKGMKFGISAKNLSDELKQRLERNRGVIVDIVLKNTPAFNADILKGDIITKLNGKDISDVEDLQNKIINSKHGDVIELEIIRNGNIKLMSVRLN